MQSVQNRTHSEHSLCVCCCTLVCWTEPEVGQPTLQRACPPRELLGPSPVPGTQAAPSMYVLNEWISNIFRKGRLVSEKGWRVVEVFGVWQVSRFMG